ncbi:MAG: hypothetical protein Q4D60_04940 [Eubacteriales bacterium]|nr:hypothetical protein [Eubacteriales bacterium]
MHRENETIGMLPESKEEFFQSGHPVIRQLREIKEIIFEDEKELPPGVLSLKKLFQRKQMDEYHIDCLVLYKIALGVLKILRKLSDIPVYPGLIDLEDFYADIRSLSPRVFLKNPGRFQILHYEQEYEWYPEDERMFGDVVLFGEEEQKKADVRLLYKVLVASAKGNVRIPPKMNQTDYSELFYQTLPDEWKQIFEGRADVDYEQMELLLRESIEMEENFARKARERRCEKAGKHDKKEEWGAEQKQGVGKTLFCLLVILRTELEEAGKISRLLYQQQDELELEASLSGLSCEQAFIYGSTTISLRKFRSYPPGFRCQCIQQIKEYSVGEALILAADYMEQTMGSRGEGEYRTYLIADGRLENDKVFQVAADLLEKRQKEGMRLYLVSGEDSQCEAFARLEKLVEHQEEGNVNSGNSTISGEDRAGI